MEAELLIILITFGVMSVFFSLKRPHHFIYLLTFIPLLATAQVNNKKLVDSLQYVTDMPYICESEPYGVGCGSKIFWKVVQQKDKIIPVLIDNLSDTTSSEAYVPNFGGKYAVADIAYLAMEEIIEGIPLFELLGVRFDAQDCGFCSYWKHVRADIKNRKRFQKAVRNWYRENKSNLLWVPSGQPFTGHHDGGLFYLKNARN